MRVRVSSPTKRGEYQEIFEAEVGVGKHAHSMSFGPDFNDDCLGEKFQHVRQRILAAKVRLTYFLAKF